jgi:hypothetical protein
MTSTFRIELAVVRARGNLHRIHPRHLARAEAKPIEQFFEAWF